MCGSAFGVGDGIPDGIGDGVIDGIGPERLRAVPAPSGASLNQAHH
jgi:hypothetical protein